MKFGQAVQVYIYAYLRLEVDVYGASYFYELK